MSSEAVQSHTNYNHNDAPGGCLFTSPEIYFSHAGVKRNCSVTPNINPHPVIRASILGAHLKQFFKLWINTKSRITEDQLDC